MVRKNSSNVPQVIQNPELLMSREEAQSKLLERIAKGDELVARNIVSQESYDELEKDEERWHEFNQELLRRMFSSEKPLHDYENARIGSYTMNQGWPYWNRLTKGLISDKQNKLKAIFEKLELIPVSSAMVTAKQVTTKAFSRKVFVVHGHDDGMKNTVARVLTSMELEPIILHEQASGGKTIIEKIEHYSDVDFAIILMSPDDIGYAKDRPESSQLRARQNVLLELGYFIGKLGRENVGALFVEGVEVPSDFHGVVYIPYDKIGGWKYVLAKEMMNIGIDIDMRNII